MDKILLFPLMHVNFSPYIRIEKNRADVEFEYREWTADDELTLRKREKVIVCIRRF